MGKIIKIPKEINCQINLQDKNDKRKIIKIGKINSAEDKPNHIVLKALPRLLLKYLEIAVDEVCDIKPCPENLIKKIPKISKYKLFINEKKKLERNNKKTTIIE
tara:strand:- start:263 stop:574 length:312 start_codon:yes stop_codon:yes gene_type:complete